jgi:hypothetical protein
VISLLAQKEGQARFTAVSLYCGYFCLLLTGIFMTLSGEELYWYDITVHMFFIGFVFSMIFAHGPIILPGVLGTSLRPYRWPLYVWLIILHSSLIARVLADAFLLFELKLYSGILTGLAILGYFFTMVLLLIQGQRGLQHINHQN